MAETIGARIRKAREAAGLSQEELARKSGIDVRQKVTDIEGGARQVKAAELLGLSRALKVDVDYLLRPQTAAEPKVLWRNRPESDAESKQTAFLSRYERYQQALACAGLKPPSLVPDERVDFGSFSFEDAAVLASEIGRTLGLGARPSADLPALLEGAWDILIWHLDLEEGSAACTRTPSGSAVLVNRSEAPWRRNYDLAHELFHLVTWTSTIDAVEDSPEAEPRIETLANVFASSLLMPGDELRKELSKRGSDGGIEYSELVGLAREFGVSTSALVWRLVTVNVITASAAKTVLNDPEFRRVDRASWKGAWFEAPPMPEHFVRTAYLAYSRGCLSRSLLAKYLDTSLLDLDSRLEEYGYTETGGSLAFSDEMEAVNVLEDESSSPLRLT